MRPFHLFRSVQPTARRTSAIGQRTRIRCNNSWNNSSVDGPQFCKPYSQAMRYGIGKSNPPRKHYGDPFRSAGERISISANILGALEGVAGWRGANLDAFCCCRCSPSQAALRYMFPPAVANLSNLQPQTNWHGKNVFIESGRKCWEEGRKSFAASCSAANRYKNLPSLTICQNTTDRTIIKALMFAKLLRRLFLNRMNGIAEQSFAVFSNALFYVDF